MSGSPVQPLIKLPPAVLARLVSQSQPFQGSLGTGLSTCFYQGCYIEASNPRPDTGIVITIENILSVPRSTYTGISRPEKTKSVSRCLRSQRHDVALEHPQLFGSLLTPYLLHGFPQSCHR